MWEGVERTEASVSDERSPERVLSEPLDRKWLAFFVECLRERMCVDGVGVLDGNVRIVFAKSGTISGGFRLSLDDYDAASIVLRAWRY